MNDLDRIKEQNRQIDGQNYEIVARLSRIEEQNRQIIAMLQGQYPANWQGEKP